MFACGKERKMPESEKREIKGRFKSADPERTAKIKQAVRDRLLLPEKDRPSIHGLARELGVTPAYVRELTRKYEAELKGVRRKPTVSAEQLESIRQKILEGDLAVIEQYKEMAVKMMEQAIKKGDTKAARLLFEHVIGEYREKERPQEDWRTCPTTQTINAILVQQGLAEFVVDASTNFSPEPAQDPEGDMLADYGAAEAKALAEAEVKP